MLKEGKKQGFQKGVILNDEQRLTMFAIFGMPDCFLLNNFAINY